MSCPAMPSLVSSVTPVYAQLSVAVMVLSLYWIYQFFQMFVSYVVGGCVLWVFLRPEDEPLDPAGRTLLYMQVCCVPLTHLHAVHVSVVAYPNLS